MLNRSKPSDYAPLPVPESNSFTNGNTTPVPPPPVTSASSSSSPAPVSSGFKAPVSDVVNIISKGTFIQGDIQSEGEIRIDGKVKGVVSSKSKVVVGNDGIVEGDIVCTNADILGTISGTIKVSELLYLRSSALVNGDVTTRQFQMEPTARFNGRCIMEVESLMTTIPDNKEKEREKERERDKDKEKKTSDATPLFQKATV